MKDSTEKVTTKEESIKKIKEKLRKEEERQKIREVNLSGGCEYDMSKCVHITYSGF